MSRPRLARMFQESDMRVVGSVPGGEYLVRDDQKMTEIFFRPTVGPAKRRFQAYGPDHKRDAGLVVEAMINFHGTLE